MEKVEFHFEMSEEAIAKKRVRVEKLLQNAIVLKWMKMHQVDEKFIFQNSGRFSDYAETMAKCENCKGLLYCTQKLKGQRMVLFFDQFLSNALEPCDYLKRDIDEKKHLRNYTFSDFPTPYVSIDLEKLDLSKESAEYINVYQKAINIILGRDREKGLYLWGTPGSGKTYLLAGIANYFAKKEKVVAFVNVPSLMGELKRLFHDHEVMEQKIRLIQKAEILVLDDIGGESVSSWTRDEILLPIVDARMKNNFLTLFSSNYSLEELKERMTCSSAYNSEPMAAERLIERIRSLANVHFLVGKSRRK